MQYSDIKITDNLILAPHTNKKKQIISLQITNKKFENPTYVELIISLINLNNLGEIRKLLCEAISLIETKN